MTADAGASALRGDDVRIGRAGKPHGNDGRLYLHTPAFPGVLEAGVDLRVGERELRIVEVGGMPERPIVQFAGIADRATAAELAGLELWAPRAMLPPLGEGEWYASDLEGMDVTDETGRRLGEVVRVVNAPSTDVIEVHLADGGELLVPVGDDAIRELSVERELLVVDSHFLDI